LPLKRPSSGNSPISVTAVIGPTALSVRNRATASVSRWLSTIWRRNGGLDQLDLPAQHIERHTDAVLDRRCRRPLGPARLAVAGLAELAPTGDQVTQSVIGLNQRRQAALAEFALCELGEQPGIHGIGLGLDAAPAAECCDLVGMDAAAVQSGGNELLAELPFETAAGL
jgi:hypothetical protein